jgi:periplasmic copper chaperone A
LSKSAGSRLSVSLLTAALWTTLALGQQMPLTVTDAWIRAVPGSGMAAAYMTLHNSGAQAITVSAVQTSAAADSMIHETSTENGMSRMRAHEQLVIAPGATIKLQPGALHVMLHDLTRPLDAGQAISLVLKLQDGRTVNVTARVRPLLAE